MLPEAGLAVSYCSVAAEVRWHQLNGTPQKEWMTLWRPDYMTCCGGAFMTAPS